VGSTAKQSAVNLISSPSESEETHNGPVKILVVDDLPEKLLAYRTLLEELGQHLITAASGEEALRLVLKHDFAVILLDVNLPGIDGFETAALIRQRKKSARTPIIFLTAFTDEMYAAQGYASGAVDYLPTPVVPEVLQAKVRVFIELYQMRRQAALQAEERAKRTAAEESARRSAFLAMASELFNRSQRPEDITRFLVEHTVPYLADMSLLWLDDANGGSPRAEMAWMDADGKIHSEPLPSLAAFPWFMKAVQRSAASGRFQLLPTLPAPAFVADDTISLKIRQVFTWPRMESALLVPLSFRGQKRGMLAMVRRKRMENPYPPGDVSLATDLVSRASVALENAMLIEQVQEADRRKDEFLGMLAHELRNPLGPIRNATQLLQRINPQEPRVNELRDIIDRQVIHMVRLIDDLLDATRLAHGKILLRQERCELNRLVQQTVSDYHSIFDASGVNLIVEVPSAPVWMEGDPTRLVQSIGNLLHNAHKFTNPGGEVSVRLLWQKGQPAATISVRDNGIGIDAKMLPCIFDVFRQAEQGLDRSRGGLGLGLALVQGLVKLHGGSVVVASEGQGKGAEFTLSLPVVESPEVPIIADAIVPIPEGKKYRILVIEDNSDMAESARLLLSGEGYDVRTAHNGSEGLEIARAFQPEVILCDIGLPGMDGYQVARSIRQDLRLASAYVIALTGYGRDEDQRQAQEAGFDMHMIKPIDYNNLRRTLAHLPVN
jgi:signal transduction histidine kinase/CheY-like chemotaxis protein